MALADVNIRKAPPREKAYKLFDGGGYLSASNPHAESYGVLSIVLGTNEKPSRWRNILTLPYRKPVNGIRNRGRNWRMALILLRRNRRGTGCEQL